MLDFAGEFGLLISNDDHPEHVKFMLGEQWILSVAVWLWELITKNPNKSNQFTIEESIGRDTTGTANRVSFSIYQPGSNLDDLIVITEDKNSGRISTLTKLMFDKSDPYQPKVLFSTGRISPESSTNPSDYYTWLLQDIVNAQIIEYPTQLFSYVDESQMRFRQKLVPQCLLAYMWYEFFQVLTGERIIKQCRICGRFSDLTESNSKNSPNWAHTNCKGKVRVYRNRGISESTPRRNPGRPKKRSTGGEHE